MQSSTAGAAMGTAPTAWRAPRQTQAEAPPGSLPPLGANSLGLG
jgi:hypothetical protein